MVPESVATMKPGGVLIGAKKRFFRARIDRDIGATEFHRIERIAGGLLNWDIPGDGCDRDHPDFGGAESHDEGNRIIGGSVGIDQKGVRHPRSIANQVEKIIIPGANKPYGDPSETWGSFKGLCPMVGLRLLVGVELIFLSFRLDRSSNYRRG